MLVTRKRVVTDRQGRADVVLRARDPGDPHGRRHQSAVLFLIGDGDVLTGPLSQMPPDALTVLVFKKSIQTPTWAELASLLSRYGRLYPFMKSVADLTDYDSVVGAPEVLARLLSLPDNDPAQFLVSRDLSPKNRSTLITWLNGGAPRSL